MTWDEMMKEIKKSIPEALETIEKAQVYAKLLYEFVDKNAVMEAYCKDCPVEDCKVYCVDVQWIFELPAADVAPVIHAHWIKVQHHYFQGEYEGGTYTSTHCSNCGVNTMFPLFFCPTCGAKMDLEE